MVVYLPMEGQIRLVPDIPISLSRKGHHQATLPTVSEHHRAELHAERVTMIS